MACFGLAIGRRDASGFAVRAHATSTDGVRPTTAWVALPHPEDLVELRWTRSLPGLADGRLELFVDGLPPAVIEGLATDDRPLTETGLAVTHRGRPATLEVPTDR